MYGETLPATGATTITLLGMSFSGFWLGFALLTAGCVVLAVARIMPKKQV